MAYAKGLVAALGVELVTIGTLELLAMPVLRGSDLNGGDSTNATVCPMVDARKGEVYGAVYGITSMGPDEIGTLQEVVAPCARSPESMIELARPFDPMYLGTGTKHYRALVESVTKAERIADEASNLPSTEFLCSIAADLVPLAPEAVRSLEPRYIRPSDAVFKRLKPIDPNV
jgi:tRNA A37 threonylcarbamoyladenosine modification protein TsaB